MRAGQTAEAELLFFQSLEINSRHSPTLTTRSRTANYALFLLRTRRFKEGLEMALAAAETDPREQRNRDLVVELKGKIDSATRTVQSPSRQR